LAILVAPPIRQMDEVSPEPEGEGKFCVLTTSTGTIKLELFEKEAPTTCKNFFRYVESSRYNGTIIHRVVKNFVIQGGSYNQNINTATTAAELKAKQRPTLKAIKNEASADRQNRRGTIAMARVATQPDSATNQFYINVNDNKHLDVQPGNAGWCVFGKVVEGMDVVDKIAAVAVGKVVDQEDVPRVDVIILSAKRVQK
jgi:cyclophilin family peptidyl-prolyl cis-trans isomerase